MFTPTLSQRNRKTNEHQQQHHYQQQQHHQQQQHQHHHQQHKHKHKHYLERRLCIGVSLLPHYQDLSIFSLTNHFMSTAVGAHCLAPLLLHQYNNKEKLNSTNNSSSADVIINMQEFELDLHRILFHHMCQTQTNVYGTYVYQETEQEKCDKKEEARVARVEQRRLSEAIYPTCSLLNHSCKPNTILNYQGRFLVIR